MKGKEDKFHQDKNANVLLADDEILFLRATKEILMDSGYNVTITTDSEEVISALRQKEFDLLLLDHKMPGNRNFELVRKLRKHFPQVPVIIITGFPSLSLIGDLFELDVFDYISKPVSYPLLKKRVACAVEQRRLQKELALSYENLELQVMSRTDELREANNQLLAEAVERAHLEQLVLNTMELENRRIGKDLHDDLGQTLTAMAYKIKALEMSLAPYSNNKIMAIDDIKDLVNGAINKTRTLSFALCPMILESQGLECALGELANSSSSMFGVVCEFVCPEPIRKVESEVAKALFRIAQEALTNAVKHSDASLVLIKLSVDGSQIKLMIVDDGIGFSTETKNNSSQGLPGMRYRAKTIGADLSISNNDNGGTSVICLLNSGDK